MKLFLLTLFFISTLFLFADVFHSTPAGGYWGDATTWAGTDIIPGAGDDVYLHGPVNSADHSCNNLTIESGGSLTNHTYTSRSHWIYGNLVNNGIISNGAYNNLTINVYGNISNNGQWDNYTVNLEGTSDQSISMTVECHSDRVINNNSSGIIYGLTNLTFNDTNIDFNNHTLHLLGALIANNNAEVDEIVIQANGNTIMLSNASYIQYADVYNCSFGGTVLIASSVELFGEIVNNGTLENHSYTHRNMYIYGNLTNYGTIKNGTYNTLNIHLTGNLFQYGAFDNQYLYLIGTTDQNITCTQELAMQYFIHNNASGVINTLSEITFNYTTFDFNSQTLYLGGNLTLTNDTSIDEINILANGYNIYDDGTGDFGVTSITNCSFSGICTFAGSVDLFGTIINNGIMQNHTYTNYQVDIDGNFTNNGTVRDNPSGSTLYLSITGNIINNGVWDHQILYLTGSDQHISAGSTNSFTVNYIYGNSTRGNIYIDSDIELINADFDLNSDNIILQNSNTVYLDNSSIDEGSIEANNATIHSTNASFLFNLDISDVQFDGTTQIADSNVYINGYLINHGILQNRNNNHHSLHLYGNLTNNGTIRNNPTNYTLYINSYGDIYNYGTWDIQYLYFKGTGDQHITCGPGNYLEVYTISGNNTRANLYFDSDVTFVNTAFDLNDDNMILLSNSLLTLDNSRLYDGVVTSNSSTLHMENDAYINDLTFGDITLTGVCNIADSYVDFNGATINNGILQNQPNNNHTIDLNGDFINNGTVRNNPLNYTFSIRAAGDIDNNGIWTNQYIYLTGTLDQHITCGAGNFFDLYTFAGNSSGVNVYLDSDVEFVDTIVDLNDDVLILQSGNKLTINGGYIYDGVINANGADIHLENNAYIGDMNIEDATFTGVTNIVDGYVDFYGSTVNNGILQNYSTNTQTLDIFGDLENNGTIRNNPANYLFYIDIGGNIINNGTFDNQRIDLLSDTTQTISLVDDNYITAITRFWSDI